MDSVPSLSIGVIDGPSELQLAGVSALAILDNGGIAIANGASREIRVYKASGELFWKAGRRGQGPGEFDAAPQLASYRGDSLLAFDFGLRRYSVFDSLGRFGRSWRLDLPDDSTPSGSLLFTGSWSDGTIAVQGIRAPRGLASARVTRYDVRLFRFDPTGRAIAQLGRFPGLEWFEAEGPGGVRPLPFGRTTMFAARFGYTYAGTNDTYEIRMLRPDGTLARLIRRHEAPRRVTDKEGLAEKERLRQARRAARATRWRGMPKDMLDRIAAAEEALFDQLPFPPTYPAFGRLVVDREGYLWVASFMPAEPTSPERWSVFHPDGRWLGSVALPPRYSLYDATATHVLGVQRDSAGVEFVRAFRIIGRTQ